MSTDIKIKKGLNIKLKGVAQNTVSSVTRSKIFSINPPHFHGITPKMVVKVGERVNVGDTIFYSKQQEKIKFTSPVSGEIKEIVRGPKRVILSIQILADKSDTFKDFGVQTPDNLTAPQIKKTSKQITEFNNICPLIEICFRYSYIWPMRPRVNTNIFLQLVSNPRFQTIC